MAASFSKPDSDEVKTSALQASHFLLGWIQEKNSSGAEERHAGEGVLMIRRMRVGETRSSTSAGAVISETRAEVEDGGPGLRYACKLPPKFCRPPSLLDST